MFAARRNRFAPSLESLESRDGPSGLGLAMGDWAVDSAQGDLGQAAGGGSQGDLGQTAVDVAQGDLGQTAGEYEHRDLDQAVADFAQGNLNQTVVDFAQSNLNQTVRWALEWYGNEQCTDLVLAALTSAGAKTVFDYGTIDNNGKDLIWGDLALRRTVGGASSGDWSDIKPGDILQLSDVMIVNPDGGSAVFWGHSAVVAKNLGNGQITVLEQNVNGHHYVEENTYDLANMTQGTVWVYHPVAR
jgi:hypothetical protein